MTSSRAAWYSLALLSGVSLAGTPTPNTLPTGGAVQHGNVSIRDATVNGAGGRRLQIDQSSQRAIIHWDSFDIGSASEVRFNQPNAGASVLNRILDANPTVIQGKLSANGQVYLINRNGILFDRGSQVDVHTLMVTSLDIDDEIYKRLGLAAGNGTPSLTGAPGAELGSVELKGLIQTAAGGAVYIFAPKVRNEGVIRAPDGQVILAAGNVAYLYENPDDKDVSMRGLLVEVKAADGDVNLTSLVTNAGQIHADRGNVTMAGLAVNQQGIVTASTAALQNGSIWLLAKTRGDSGSVGKTGHVSLAAGSLTATPLDTQDTTTLAEDQDYSPYRAVVRMEGKTIDHAGILRAPAGVVSFIAYDAEQPSATGTTRIHLDRGSIIDVAGNWADLALEKTFLTVKLTSNELKDAPLQKGGFLQGQSVTLDLRRGTPLFDYSGFAGSIKRSVREKAAVGGEVRLESRNGDIIQRVGSVVDVSGGGYRYAPGAVETTRFTANGRTYDIANASPDILYDGTQNVFVQRDGKWGVTERFVRTGGSRALAEAASVEGKNAGAIFVTATAGAVLDGKLRGGAMAGRYQLDAAKLPQAGRFVGGDASALSTGALDFKVRNVRFASGPSLADNFAAFEGGTLAALPEALRDDLSIQRAFFATGTARADGGYDIEGFGDIALLANQQIHMARSMHLEMPVGGSLLLAARDLRVDGAITARGGKVDLRALRTAGTSVGNPSLHLSESARIDASGLWINDRPSASAHTVLPRVINGGSVRMTAYDLVVEPGSIVDVSGGGALGGTLALGNGGLLRSVAGQGAGVGDSFLTILEGDFRGEALGKGAALEISTGRVRIAQDGVAVANQWLLNPARLSTGGFASYSVDGRFELSIADGARIEPRTLTRVLDRKLADVAPSGADIKRFSALSLLPPFQRSAANLTLSSSDNLLGSLDMGAGAVIAMDPRAVVALRAVAGMTLRGRVEAPSGEIRLNLDGGDNNAQLPDGTLRLTDGAALVARGTFIQSPDALGLMKGEILGGGEIKISTFKNKFVAEAGSLIDVSGIAQSLDLPASSGRGFEQRVVAANAGTVTMASTQGARLEGELRATPAGGGAGGSFALDLLRHNDSLLADAPHRIVLGSRDAVGDDIQAFVPLKQLAAAGFDKVRLRSADSIDFRSDVVANLGRSLRLDAREMRASAGVNVSLAAPRVALGGSGNAADPFALPQPILTTAGDAHLQIQAGVDGEGMLDLFGHVTLNGFSQVRLRSTGDIRLTGNIEGAEVADGVTYRTGITGSLTTDALDVALHSRRLYPTSGSAFEILQHEVVNEGGGLSSRRVARASLSITRDETDTRSVLSAMGALRISADRIVQSGDIRAPLGSIDLDAGSALTLSAGSRTSVTADGSVIPFGATLAGRQWLFAGLRIGGLKTKRVDLRAAHVEVAQGAVVDISGGGDVLAAEFVAGPGGSRDTLLKDNTFAIVPWLDSAFAPTDPHLSGMKDQGVSADRNVYDSVYLSAGSGLAAGRYALLPAYYALLPGAFVVRPLADASYRDLPPGRPSRLASGATVVAGYRTVAGTRAAESRWSGFAVRSGADTRRESEYRVSTTDILARALGLSDVGVQKPNDAGQLALSAGRDLTFQGDVRTSAANGGRVAEIDIASEYIAITSAHGQAVPDGYLALDAPTLSEFRGSLLIGGTRTRSSAGIAVTVSAGDIIVSNDASAPLVAPELILAASGSITLDDGARVVGAGQGAVSTSDLIISNAAGGSDGALLRVAQGDQVGVRRAAPARLTGNLSISRSASLEAMGSILLDATGQVNMQTGAQAPVGAKQFNLSPQGQLALGAGNIKVGYTGAPDGSLILTSEQLSGLSGLRQVRLRSYDALELYGGVGLGGAGFGELEIDAARIAGWKNGAPATATLQAGRVTLINRGQGPSTSGPTPDGSGSLNIIADEVRLAQGEKLIHGFNTVDVNAVREIILQGKGGIDVAGHTTLISGRITAQGATAQHVRATGPDGRSYAMAISGNENTTGFTDVGGLGANLNFAGKSIAVSGRVDAAAGRITLESLGTLDDDRIVLYNGAALNAGAASKRFGQQTVEVDAGAITLVSAGGGVEARAGSRMNLAGSASGGNAGTLRILTPAANGDVILDGDILASSIGGSQGHLQMDTGRLTSFKALNAKLNQGGFTASRDIRLRSGDIVIDGEDPLLQLPADQVLAREVTLAADSGSIFVFGRIDAEGAAGGGKVKLYAGQDVVVGAGGRIYAQGTSTQSAAGAPYSHGGEVELYSKTGNVRFERGALIDVSAGARGDAGQVVFSASRTATNDGVLATLEGSIRTRAGSGGRAARVMIEGRREYVLDTLDASVASNFDGTSNALWGEYDTFMANASGLTHALRDADGGAFNGAAFRAGIDVRANTNLTQTAAWILSDANWLRNGQAGRLTLRAGRDLTIANALGLANDNSVDASSWALRLVGGADFSAANPLATLDRTLADSGDVILSTGLSRVLASDAPIEIAAGRDFVLGNSAAAVVTTGVVAATDPRFTTYGGNIRIAVGRDALGTANQQSINDWLRRTTRSGSGAAGVNFLKGKPGEWWTHRPLFKQNVGALGGGDVSVSAGRDVNQLSVMSPTSGRVATAEDGSALLEAMGGGDVIVAAGRDIIGGEYLLGRGAGRLTAGENIGTQSSNSALFLMGEHSDAALRGARFDLSALGDVWIRNISNPTVMVSPFVNSVGGPASGNGFDLARAAFLTYAPTSAVSATSLQGDIVLSSFAAPKRGVVNSWSNIAPPNLSLVSFSGNLRDDIVSDMLILYPSRQGSARLLAAGDIVGLSLVAADVDPSALPSWRSVHARVADGVLLDSQVPVSIVGNTSARLVQPADDGQPHYTVVAQSGDIRSARFYFPQVSEISAGRDIINLKLLAQNLRGTDRSVVAAGRDLRYTSGALGDRMPESFGPYALGVEGPGEFLVRAGRNMDLGTEPGIEARGDSDNPSLPTSNSAHLIVAAGLKRDVTRSQTDTLFAELLRVGKANDTRAANAAISALFTSDATDDGALSMVSSKIKTVGGSGIDILAPGGGVEAGLTVSQSSNEIGVITTLGGGVRSYLRDDFNINQSKVLTLQGGDILLYTKLGGIDAGRGARDSRSTQPPRRTRDPETGLVSFTPPIDAAGSGIRTLTSDPDGPGPLKQPKPGDVFLFAPSGVINAGEAGIDSAGNIVVVAVQVLNAVNINASGSATGVPTAPTTTVAATLAGSGAANNNATRGAEDVTRGTDTGAPKKNVLAENFRPTFITVEVLGIGEN